MTREEAAKYAELLQAKADGRELQLKDGRGKWVDGCLHDVTALRCSEWRIKPEPREFWLCSDDQKVWFHVRNKSEHRHWARCIKVREVIE